ncbi:hypothetical protein KP004_07280 [Geomonas oryzisoli]|uniref:DUF1990 domain-containing protein n=1 Tax=Geomonas oryzisoli TaxID=2847992 RepID=A0ABX8J961_9BACT|nr:hypothetical protein [Geomonas oryzisoli]QWV94969.1 hypothetical protein KP004_07280 [Geomonas oryzisoli]
MAEHRQHELEISCQQILLPDSSVYSVQWIELPAEAALRATPAFLLEHYFKVVRRCTLGLITPVQYPRGVEFRITGTRCALLAFSAARFEAEEGTRSVHLCISGGILVQPGECDSGMFSLSSATGADAGRVTVQLSDYCPLLLGSRNPSWLRKLCYGMTQSFFHKVVTFRYLASVFRELCGVKARVAVRNVVVRRGTDI